jgi:diguanylate cyclase
MIGSRFHTRVLLMLLAVIAVLLVPIFLTVSTAIRNGVIKHAEAELETGARVFAQLMRDRDQQLLSTVELVTADFGFKQAVATQDTATVGAMLENHGGRIGASEAAVFSLKGEILAGTTGLSDIHLDALLPDLIREAKHKRYARATLMVDGVPHQLILAPIEAPRRVAWIVMGFAMDDALVAKLKALTGLEITFVARSGDDKTANQPVITVANEQRSRARLVRLLNPGSAAHITRWGDHDFLTIALPLEVSHGSRLDAVLRASLNMAQAPYEAINNKLAAVSLLALLAALAGTLFLARAVTRPVEKLASAARRIGSGDYRQDVELRSRDELGSLADAFNNMQRAIAEREEKIVHQAFHDTLTGLPNRALANDRLQSAVERAKRAGHAVGVLMIDVDRFKEINDTLGHPTGDQLLMEIARRLKDTVRASDTVARLGGDEFLILIDCVGMDAALNVGRKLITAVATPMKLGEVEVNTDISIGVSLCPDHGSETEILLRRADIAMYEAKTSHQSPCAYQPGREEQHLYRLALINDLRRVVPNNELRVHYQPKVEFNTGAVTHVEALMRWEHPRYGQVRPDVFIPLAEHSGRIRQLTGWLLETVVKDCSAWQRQGYNVGAAINISVIDLASLDLPGLVTSALSKHGLEPQYLILEITESVVMRDATNAIAILRRLRDVGVKLAIDDFGTGYSSLSQLKRMPVHELKIDKSFVLGLASGGEDAVIVKSTIELGHNMGLRVVAEGVEDEQAWTLLRAQRCDSAQGYLISKPLPRGELMHWLEQYKASPPSWSAGSEPLLEKRAV